MVMVTARRDKQRAHPHPIGFNVESEDVAIECSSLSNISDMEMNMPHRRSARQTIPFSALRLPQQAVPIDRIGSHTNGAVAIEVPLLTRTVPVNLDAVLIRIIQVKRLADQMIRLPDPNARFDQP